VSLSDRDRKIALIVVPLVLLCGYWFMLLAPKRAEVAKADAALVKAEERRDTAQARLSQVQDSKRTFASDYAELIRLGKAVPRKVDIESVIVQLDSAARGTGIELGSIATVAAAPGAVTPGAPATAAAEGAAAPAAPGTGDGSQGAAAGGAPAESAPGAVVEGAAENVNEANAATSAGAAAGTEAAPVAPGTCPTGLQCVPLEFEFTGQFFDLATFFHRLKRYVHLSGDRVEVRGRLLSIDGITFVSGESFPQITAEVSATAYLSPETEIEAGAAAATPGAPVPAAPVPAAPVPAAPAPAAEASPAPTPPTAAVTP
jgi:hypothetical protein